MIEELQQIVQQNKIKLLNEDSLDVLDRNTQIEYICIECNKENTKSFRAFRKNHLCSTCIINNKPIPCEKSLLFLEPQVALLWHPTKNNKNPKDYTRSSMKTVWWLCPNVFECNCPHEFDANICDMVKCNSSKSKGCPYCTNMGSNKQFCIHKSLGGVFPELCKFWSNKNIKTSYQYSPHSDEEVLWNCNGCIHCGKIHEYCQKISSKTAKKRNGDIRGNIDNGGCVVCAKSTQKICDCQTLEIKYPELYKECDIEKNKEEVDPNFDINIIPTNSNRYIWWKCIKCYKNWYTRLINRTTNCSGCPYCKNENTSKRQTISLQNIIKEFKDIHNNEYEYPFIEEEYENSSSMITILCKVGHTHIVNVGHHKNSKLGCLQCSIKKHYSNKQIEWLNYIMTNNNIYIQHAMNGGEFKIPNTRYKADGYCITNNTIYEFHGDIWHGNPEKYNQEYISFIGVKYGELYQKTLIKEQKIRELGYNLVIIWESEWDLLLRKKV
jgi:hypothetical protein